MNNKAYRKIDLNSDVVIGVRFMLEQTKIVRCAEQAIATNKQLEKFSKIRDKFRKIQTCSGFS